MTTSHRFIVSFVRSMLVLSVVVLYFSTDALSQHADSGPVYADLYQNEDFGKGIDPDDVIPGVIIIKFESEQMRMRSDGGSARAARSNAEEELRLFGLISMEQVMTQTSLEDISRNRMKRQDGIVRELPDDLARTFIANISSDIDPRLVASKLSRLDGVAYAEPRIMHQLLEIPNDSLYGNFGQAYFDYQRIPQAWSVTTSNSDIVIAIVDSGVDYTHPALAPKLWRNPEPGLARSLFPGIFSEVENDTIGWNFWESGPINNATQNGNPIGTAQNHGTHVAGIAAAATNNRIGISSTGYHSNFMAVRAGGTATDPRAIGFGYEGILYAAVNGADIINCSFGSSFESQFGRDVVNFATAIGSVVVAAAGNTRDESLFYPASFENALAVTSVQLNTGTISNFSTYNYGIDVAATGTSILSTVFNAGYSFNTGTSMAAPIVSGVAALIRHEHPSWSPERIMGQIRSSANPSIYNANPQYPDRLGGGLLDAGKALSDPLPSVRTVSSAFQNMSGQKLRLQEEGRIRLELTNVGQTMNSLMYSVEIVAGSGTIGTSGGSLGRGAIGYTIVVDIPIQLDSATDPRENPAYIIRFEDQALGYRDFVHVEYSDLFIDTHEENLVRMSFSSNGGIGYGVGGDTSTGVGFVPRILENGNVLNTPNILYESGLMVMYNVDENDYFVDNVREKDVAPLNFRPLTLFEVEQSDTGEVGRALFDTSFNEEAPPITIQMNTYALSAPGPEQSVLVYFTLRNEDPLRRAYNDVYVGTYTDWDIGDFSTNSIRFSEADSVMIAYSETQSFPYATVAHLGGISSALAIDNAYEGEVDSLNFGVYYSPNSSTNIGFAPQYKRWSMVAGTEMTSRENTDISMVTASGPFTIRHQEEIVVGFSYAFGLTEADLLNQVAKARAAQVMPVTSSFNHPRVPVVYPSEPALVGNYPNPFNPSTRVVVDVDEPTETEIVVYDMLGRKVTTLFQGNLENRRYEFVFDGSDLPSGIYLVVMNTDSYSKTLRMTLLK
ncbi:MAG: S8 family peptidase [Balneolales bacterium]|nr:S8 family peptidase [Balneolales bacterium]